VPTHGDRAEKITSAFEAADIRYLKTCIYQRLDYADAIGEGLGISEYRPSSKAAREMGQFVDEILGSLK
jgi:hypothetical protein